MPSCPCGTNKTYEECCGPFIAGQQLPTTPEALMRSRYTAYTQANVEYIQKTMKEPASNDFDLEDARSWAQDVKWLKLDILETSHDDHDGKVEFIAHYSHDKMNYVLHEVSTFRCDDKQWFYIDGQGPEPKAPIRVENKISRNDPCSCGSNKKYKKCCGK